MIKNQALIDRFLRYVALDTQSSEVTGTSPSTQKQHELAKLLAKELEEMGAEDVIYDKEHCYVYALVPGTVSGAEAIGFISHMDTVDECSGADIKPRFLMNYDGKDAMLDPEEFPELARHIGKDLIATDGTTLLGADDKAGVAGIMRMAEYLLAHPEIPHRPVAVAFTPDEEIGEGTKFFDLASFKTKEAYTVDGDDFGAIEYENFNAAMANVVIRGRSVHPGTAKGLMKNASIIAMEFNEALPKMERPEHTEGREGFFMLMEMEGSVEEAKLKYIIRDHDLTRFTARKALMEETAAALNAQYGEGTVELKLRDQYYNMLEPLKEHMHLVRNAEKAIRELGGTPVSNPVRGGTDGAQLTFRGLPCPNLGMGGGNFHSRFEYAVIQDMEKTCELLIRLALC